MSKPETFKMSDQNKVYGGVRTTVTGEAEFCFSIGWTSWFR
jgi:hypothetical protein